MVELGYSAVIRFNDFLGTIDLDLYRKKYKDIKIVELDMPKNVQAIAAIYREYWDKRDQWLTFDDFYPAYRKELKEDLEEWRKKAQFSSETFYRGLPARIYRTWTSLLTQVQGGYVAESIYGRGNVEMSVKQDYRGRNLVINLNALKPGIGRLPVQIKKISWRKEATRSERNKKYVDIQYEVPPQKCLLRDGVTPSTPYRRWLDDWGIYLDKLENGFVVFRKPMFELQHLLENIIE